MKKLIKIADRFCEIIEVYIPMLLFFIVFALYVIMIANRYFFYGKTAKMQELCQIAFVWCSILAASYGGRMNSHVMFTVVYDKCSDKVKQAFDLIANLIIVITFAIMIPGTLETINFLTIKKSDMLRIPFNIIYFPFLIFVVLTMIYYLIKFIKCVMGYIQPKRGDELA